uniref:VWFA domain-containing protein n=1 Tax=Oryza punctata TaxID=4537 RepID=A0A0E0JLL5_ORYPU
MAYNDDEQTAPTSTEPARPTVGITGQLVKQVRLNKYHNDVASLAPHDQEVLLELRGSSSSTDRAGLDLVAVIDVSGSMDGDGIDKAKTALQFVIRKLSDLDRLCIVTFSTDATRLCPLRFVTAAAQAELKALVDGLRAYGITNMKGGLVTGMSVVDGRRLTAGRAVSVMLMSDGYQNHGGDARDVQLKNVPVYTFGFGASHDSNLLEAIARKSLGGTFNYVADSANLTGPFSQLLGGLLTIIAQDLELTVTRFQGEATIKRVVWVDAGTYPQTTAGDGSSVTVSFGTLYSAEARRVIVYLALADKTASPPYDANVCLAQYRFTFQAQQVTSNPDLITIKRRRSAPDAARKPRPVESELARRQHADMIRAARDMAEANNMEDARNKLEEARKALEENLDQANPTVAMLLEELRQLRGFMERQDLYNREGRPYVASSLASHDRQRVATRGQADGVRLYTTPHMDTYLKQAEQFEKNPDEAPPPATKHVPEPDQVVDQEPPPEADVPEVPRDVAAGDRRTPSAALRVATAVLSLAAFVLMASVRTSGWDSDRYALYEQYYRLMRMITCLLRLNTCMHDYIVDGS